jgi:hypothetical protein
VEKLFISIKIIIFSMINGVGVVYWKRGQADESSLFNAAISFTLLYFLYIAGYFA